MRILFGPDHDGLHISPDTPGAYEWWYFDALSDDGRFALVAIFFLGTPMSPYYKQVVDGKNPLPKDWCGVFFSLHKRLPASDVLAGGKVRTVPTEWREQGYTYNLYRNGQFEPDGARVCVGASSLRRTNMDQNTTIWHLSLHESGLWGGVVAAEVEFTSRTTLRGPGTGRDDGHTWVCVAPASRVRAECRIGRQQIRFTGHGYHDHNFGRLPWADTDIWYWGRARVTSSQSEARHIVYYADLNQSGEQETSLLFFDAQGRLQSHDAAHFGDGGTTLPERRNAYGFRSTPVFAVDSDASDTRAAVGTLHPGALVGGPFYERSPITVSVLDRHSRTSRETGEGIGEVFRPARLCGPIASRAMWTRIRRRS